MLKSITAAAMVGMFAQAQTAIPFPNDMGPPPTQCTYADGHTGPCFDPRLPGALVGTNFCPSGVQPTPARLITGECHFVPAEK